MGRGNERQAIVIGSSATGLLCGSVLSEFFERVVILERDTPPQGKALRSGLPQGHHGHIILMRTRNIYEEYFPRLMSELEQAGAIAYDYVKDSLLQVGGRWLPRFPSGFVTVSCTRGLFERVVHRRVAPNPRVEIRYEHRVIGLVQDSQSGNIAGVRVKRPDQSGNGPEAEAALPVSLVVDVSGRSSRAPLWLEQLGLEAPQESIIEPFAGYATQLFRLPEDYRPAWTMVGMAPHFPDNPRAAMLLRVEDGQLMASLVGLSKNYRGASPEDFLKFAREFPDPIIHRTIECLQPVSQVHAYRKTQNRIRHFERLRHQPKNFLALGDAVCAMNPIYGQGLALGAQAVSLLHQHLRRKKDAGCMTWQSGEARSFQARLARQNQSPWVMITSEDSRWPATAGRVTSILDSLLCRYRDAFVRLMATDTACTLQGLRAMHLLKSPRCVFSPPFLLKVLEDSLGRAFSR